ncbi:MAG: DUF7134 domain-containing protein, partial [Stackebrandtia sp.]
MSVPQSLLDRGRELGTKNPYLVDSLIGFGVLLAMSAQFVVPRAANAPPVTAASYAFTVAACIPLIWRRRFPLTALLLVTAATIGNQLVDGVGQPLPYTG